MNLKSLSIFKFNKSNTKNSSYEILFDEWQKQLFNINLWIILLSVFLEFGFLIFYISNDLTDLSVLKHINLYLIKPFLLNTLFYILFSKLYKIDNLSKETKSLLPIFLMISIISVLVGVHYVFPTLYLVWIVPLFISMIYADEQIEKKVFFYTLISLSITFLFTFFDDYSIKPNRYLTLIVITYALVCLVHFIIQKLICLENLKEDLLRDSLDKNKVLTEKLLYDGLTKLYNHSALFSFLDGQIKDKNEEMFLAVLDIDYFKKINDTYGHEAGNVVLIKLSNILRKYSSDNMFVSRYGGEEFVIVFKDMKLVDILKVLNKIRDKFSTKDCKEVDFKKITLSIGLAKYEKGLNSNQFFTKADELLYDAKNTGRDKIRY